MNYIRYSAIEGASETAAALDKVSNRKSWFAHLLDAFHKSRRLQAARMIHQYRHLLHKGSGHETPQAVQKRNIAKESSRDADQH